MTARGAVRQAFTADELELLADALNVYAVVLHAGNPTRTAAQNLRLRVQHYQRRAAAQEAKRS